MRHTACRHEAAGREYGRPREALHALEELALLLEVTHCLPTSPPRLFSAADHTLVESLSCASVQTPLIEPHRSTRCGNSVWLTRRWRVPPCRFRVKVIGTQFFSAAVGEVASYLSKVRWRSFTLLSRHK